VPILFALIFIISCSDDETDCCALGPETVAFSILNEQRENLLDPETENYILESEILFFYKNDDTLTPLSTKNYSINIEGPTKYFTIFPLSFINGKTYEVFVKLGDFEMDTIRFEYQTNSKQKITKVFINNELVFDKDTHDGDERIVNYIKA